MSEIFAVQLTAAATLALAVLALATAVLAYLAWRKQSREVSDQAEMLRLQAAELRQVSAEREREARERHRAQAAQVYLRLEYISPVYDADPAQLGAYVRNTSQQPVHGVRVRWLLNGKPYEHYYETTATVMPGEEHEVTIDLPRDRAPRDFSVSAYFSDRAGTWWQTWPYGHLEEIPEPPSPIERSSRSEPAAGTTADAGE